RPRPPADRRGRRRPPDFGRAGASPRVSGRGLRLALPRSQPQPQPPVVHDGGLRQRVEGAAFPAACAAGREAQRGPAPRTGGPLSAVLVALALPLAALPSARADEPLSPQVLGRVDAHAHVFAQAPEILRVLERLNVTAVNVCVVDRYDKGFEQVAPQHEIARQLARESRGRLPWVATFDDSSFAQPDFASRTIADLERALADGAVGVKIYKS